MRRLSACRFWLSASVCAAVLSTASCDSAPPRAVPQPFARRGPTRAVLHDLRGDVKVKRAAADDWSSASEGCELSENDKVRTAGGASATLVFQNGSQVGLSEDALISIAQTRPRPGQGKSDLTVFKGRVDAELRDAAAQSLSVSTPAAVIRAGREIVFR